MVELKMLVATCYETTNLKSGKNICNQSGKLYAYWISSLINTWWFQLYEKKF